MKLSASMVGVFLAAAAIGSAAPAAHAKGVPSAQPKGIPAKLAGDYRSLSSTVSYGEMVEFLESVARPGWIEFSREGESVEGRGIFLVHLSRGGARARWRALFVAQQHGNEVSGKDALLFLIRDIAEKPERLPEDVDLWVMPMMNPDGAEADRRVNAAGADLNRDHVLLAQPETQTLHRVARRVLPHLAVDCHEFTRDSDDYRARGLIRWPIIMMDAANNPLFDPGVIHAGLRWVTRAETWMRRAGHAYERYSVGGFPPDLEQRHSTLDANDARNGLAMYGGLGFIIEAGVQRVASSPQANLGQRVDAYRTLLQLFLEDRRARETDLRTVEASRARSLPPFLPTNYFWANAEPRLTAVKAIEMATGATREIITPNFMKDVIIKRSVPTPASYVIEPAAAPRFRPLLERHGIVFETVASPRMVRAERCFLVRVEQEVDEVYERYQGRQIVKRMEAAERELAVGSLVVTLDQAARLRVALVLEPTAMYGLYQYPEFRSAVGKDGSIPVLRILDSR